MVDDNTIIAEVLKGNIESFRIIVQRYEITIFSMVKNFINDIHTCEDVAQDVFVAAYKNLDSFDPEKSKFATWLFAIAKNKSINALKKKRPVPIEVMPEILSPNEPEKELAEKEFYKLLDKALQELSIEHKTAFILAEIENLTYEEIAKIEGVKLGTIKSRINRAKEKLRKIIEVPQETNHG